MRVTSSMLTAQVVANLGRNLSRFSRMEEQLSSTRRINRPSDDPMGTLRVLEYRHELEQIGQFQKDVQFGQAWLGGTDQALSSLDDLLIEAFDITLNMSNDTIPDDQRDSLAGRVSAIIDQALEAANARQSGRYLFSGTLTDQPTLIASSSGVVFNGNTSALRTKLGGGSMMDLNSIGSETFTRAFMTLGQKFDLDVAISSTTPLSQLNAGKGIQQLPGIFSIKDHNGTLTAFINASTCNTVGDLITVINSTMAAFGMGNVKATIAPTGDGIRLTATPNGIVRTNTLVSNLNLGEGIAAPPTFVMHKTDGSADVQINLGTPTRVSDVITSFNSQMAAAGFGTVTMSLRPDNKGLRITDTKVPPNVFEVQEVSGSSSTAHDLGFSGMVQASLTGGDLNPQPDFEVKEFGGGLTTAADLGLLGRFHNVKDSSALNPILTTNTSISQLNNGLGVPLGKVRLSLGDRFASVDLSSATTIGGVLNLLNASGLPVEARINASNTGIEIYSRVDDRSFMVTSDDTLHTAEKLGIVGSPDVFGSLYLLRKALEENNRDLVRTTNESLQGALDQIVFERSRTGSRQIRLEATDAHLVEQNLSVTRLRSRYEDADILALSSDLSKQEAVYQAALAAAARMIQPSLAQFLS